MKPEINCTTEDLSWWSVDICNSKSSMQRLGVALIETGAALGESRLLVGKKWLLVVALHADAVQSFKATCQPVRMQPHPIEVG